MGTNLKETHYLHYAVVHQDINAIQKLISENKISEVINTYDMNGNTPLTLALHLKNNEIVKLLLDNGAEVDKGTKSGWTPLQTALASGHLENIELFYSIYQRNMKTKIMDNIKNINDALKITPNFYLEIAWEFNTFIPFVSRYIPSDIYKIYKKGGNIRIDSTIQGRKDDKWQQGDISLILKENSSSLDVFVIDHINKKVESFIDSYKYHPKRFKRDIRLLSGQELLSSQIYASSVKFEPQTNWRGVLKEEKVNGFNCKIYTMDGLKCIVQNRIFNGSNDNKDIKNHSIGDNLDLNWDQYCKRFSPQQDNSFSSLLYKNESIKLKDKAFKGSVYIATDFPRKIKEFLPLLKSIFKQYCSLEEIEQFIDLKLPNDGFPIRIDIPVFPMVTSSLSIKQYEEKEIDDDIFTIPEDYTQKTKRNSTKS